MNSNAAAHLSGDGLRFNLFARFATSELTHSGVWGWILQSLNEGCPPQLLELQPAARALLQRIEASSLGPGVEVSREQNVPKGPGRVDILVTDALKRVVVIETKVKARPSREQLRGYRESYQSEGQELIGIAIVSTTFDEPWTDVPDVQHVGARALLSILRARAEPYESDTMRQYVDWLAAEIAQRELAVEQALGIDPDRCNQALNGQAAQWGVMARLGDKLGRRSDARLYAGRNKGGTAWCELCFSQGAQPGFDKLFYRIEAGRKKGQPVRFTLNQYENPPSAGKAKRLRYLRERFLECVEATQCSIPFDTQLPGSGSRNRARVAQLLICGAAVPSAILAQLPSVHARFVAALREEGWPIGG